MRTAAESLKDEIRRAFDGVKLGDGNTLRECVALDARMDPNHPDLKSIPDYQRWQDIPDHMAEYIGSHAVLIWCERAGIKFYLPLAMTFVLSNYHGDFSSPAFHVACAIDSRERDFDLNSEQTRALESYTAYMANEYPEFFSSDA